MHRHQGPPPADVTADTERGSLSRRRALLAGAVGAVGIGAAAGPLAFADRASAAGAGDDPYSVDVISKGADPTGKTPSDAAFRAAAADVLASFQPGPISGAIPKRVIVIPPGNYLLTQPDSLLPNVDGSTSGGIVDGIAITGYGKRLSRITYSPSANDTTLWTNNQRYKNIRISGLTFTSTNATSSFNYAYSSAAVGVQDTWYTDVEWRGAWTRAIGLDGPNPSSNLNSEMGWDHCQVGGSYSDAFLVVGMTPGVSQQDQFLNYWFRDCKVEFSSGVFVKNKRGGSMNFTGGSYIITDTQSTSTFFQLTADAPSRNDSAMRLYAQGIRFEIRADTHKVIDSNWYKGTITFVSCDDTSQSFRDWAAGALSHQYAFTLSGSRGPMVRYVDCALMGYHHIVTAATAMTAGKVLYDGCRLFNQSAGTGDSGFLRWEEQGVSHATPRYEFRDCLGGAVYLPDDKAG
ncbi:hypothetical protein DSM104299_00496 [Baekduia alba]|uniref:hypothetical protein n=1 Tax=Baekduia alba TaxID=2997333 RepID=UPI0023414874|nr:hypothetical protein [Baekduia alba]WCB91818.1 hypothetical protein DSM104299_00496 [Baekduia alba]